MQLLVRRGIGLVFSYPGPEFYSMTLGVTLCSWLVFEMTHFIFAYVELPVHVFVQTLYFNPASNKYWAQMGLAWASFSLFTWPIKIKQLYF